MEHPRPTPLTAHEFRRLIDRAAAARDSLSSCRATFDEIECESAAVARVVAELKTATLRRPSDALERERAGMLQSIGRTAEYRLAQLRQIRASSQREQQSATAAAARMRLVCQTVA